MIIFITSGVPPCCFGIPRPHHTPPPKFGLMVPDFTLHTNLLKRFLKNTCDNLLLMKKNLILLSLLISCSSFAQSNLPGCTSPPFNNCFGEWTHSTGDKYVGEWLNDKRNGEGVFEGFDGNKYIGQWKDGKRNGYGTDTFVNGNKYAGLFKDNKRHGQGILTYSDGTNYSGQWIEGEADGQGTMTHSNGNKYVGQWRNGKYHGQGILNYYTGAKYVGQWRNGEYHGQGALTSIDMSYEGAWKNGEKNGQGTYVFPNGAKYVGQWKDGNYNGLGTFFYPDGTIFQKGLWKDDKFVQPQASVDIAPVVPKSAQNNPQDLKRQRCISLGLTPSSADFQQCTK